jgi:hypothetical protein
VEEFTPLDTGEFPVPQFDALASGFSATKMAAESPRWYIVAGLNKVGCCSLTLSNPC